MRRTTPNANRLAEVGNKERPLLSRAWGAFLATSLIIFVIGLLYEPALDYTFLATTTYVGTDIVLGVVFKTGSGPRSGWIKVLGRGRFASRADGYYVLLAFILVIAPVLAIGVAALPGLVAEATVNLGPWSLLAKVLGFAFGSMGVVYGYLRWLTRTSAS